jgi:hypothetical protein
MRARRRGFTGFANRSRTAARDRRPVQRSTPGVPGGAVWRGHTCDSRAISTGRQGGTKRQRRITREARRTTLSGIAAVLPSWSCRSHCAYPGVLISPKPPRRGVPRSGSNRGRHFGALGRTAPADRTTSMAKGIERTNSPLDLLFGQSIRRQFHGPQSTMVSLSEVVLVTLRVSEASACEV